MNKAIMMYLGILLVSVSSLQCMQPPTPAERMYANLMHGHVTCWHLTGIKYYAKRKNITNLENEVRHANSDYKKFGLRAGLRALHLATSCKCKNVCPIATTAVERLIACGYDVNDCAEGDISPLLLAVAKRNYASAYMILKEEGWRSIPKHAIPGAITPVLMAVKTGDTEIVKMLHEWGHRVYPEMINAADADGNTPLHIAIAQNDLDNAEFLLRNGANRKIKNNTNHTPRDFSHTIEMQRLLHTFAN